MGIQELMNGIADDCKARFEFFMTPKASGVDSNTATCNVWPRLPEPACPMEHIEMSVDDVISCTSYFAYHSFLDVDFPVILCCS